MRQKWEKLWDNGDPIFVLMEYSAKEVRENPQLRELIKKNVFEISDHKVQVWLLKSELEELK